MTSVEDRAEDPPTQFPRAPLDDPLPPFVASIRDYQCSGLTRSYEVVRALFECEVIALGGGDVKNRLSAFMLISSDPRRQPQFCSQTVLRSLYSNLYAYCRVHEQVVPETRPMFVLKYLNDPLRKVYRGAEIFPHNKPYGEGLRPAGASGAVEDEGEGEDHNLLEAYNFWRGYRFDNAAPPNLLLSAVQKLDAAIDVLVGGDPRAKKYVLDWLVAALQQPWIKRGVAIVFEARDDAGMRLVHAFMKLLRDMLGDQATTVTDSPNLLDELSHRLLCKTFFCVAELSSVSRSFVNALIDEARVPIQQKYTILLHTRSCHQFLFSCKENALLREQIGLDPRFYLVSSCGAHDTPPELFECRRRDIADLRGDPECLRTIYWWLKRRSAADLALRANTGNEIRLIFV